MKVSEYFEKNRYVYLSNVLSQKECAELAAHMFDLEKENLLINDEQCPLSKSVYGDPVFDGLLERLAKPLSTALGINLIPTYTYCRIYKPGEVLKRHIDRESCEISGTMTLAYDPGSEIWPIKFGKDAKDEVGQSIQIDVGDMVMYRGNELVHWRPEYKGLWQIQIFFHYVDGNGPHKDWKFDKRKVLGVDRRKPPETLPVLPVQKKVEFPLISIPSGDDYVPAYCAFTSKFKPELTFSEQECAAIMAFADNKYPEKARVGTGEVGKYDSNVRRVDVFSIDHKPETSWIFEKIVAAVYTANKEYFDFEIKGITHALQLLHYESKDLGFYDWHTDTGNGEASTRKISVVVPLSSPFDYEGGALMINNMGNIIKAEQERGSISLFPSYIPHKVEPVTGGHRWSLVSWIHGSRRFR